jgi:hypothetical protein
VKRAIAGAFGLLLVAAARVAPGNTAAVVSIIMDGTYFIEPANVSFLVAVEPNEENRFLWVEADGGDLYRASETTLSGAREKRLHQVTFKNLPDGRYTLRAAVRSRSAVRGVATRSIEVTGTEAR